MKGLLVYVLVAVVIAIIVILSGLHDAQIEKNRTWTDVGTVISIDVVPTSWNKYTRIETSGGSFVVHGIVGMAIHNARVSVSNDGWLRIDGCGSWRTCGNN
jgi:hypothetical protein